jgi:hypothetical protein
MTARRDFREVKTPHKLPFVVAVAWKLRMIEERFQ